MAAVLLATLLVPGSASGDDGTADPQLSPDARHAIHFRESLGLDAETVYVERSLLDSAGFPDLSYGVPLTQSEADDLDSRWERARLTQPGLDYAMAQDEYAGMYFDQHQKGRPVFRFTDRPETHAAALASILPPGLDAAVVPADRSWKELLGIYHEIIENRVAWKSRLPLVAVDVDVVANRVTVGLERPMPDAPRELAAVYGDAVAIEVLGAAQNDSCTSRNNCGGTSTDPWKGGLKIFLSGNTGIWCTSGAMARRGSNLVMITAAHCLVNNPSDYGDNWRHNTSTPRTIGDALGGNIADGANDGCPCHGDVGWIDVDNYASVTPLDLFLAGSSSDLRSFNAVPGDSDTRQQVGQVICRSGATSGYVCGLIDKWPASRLGGDGIDGHPVDQLRRTDFDASPGDSGAVMFYINSFLGIHNDSLTGIDPPAAGHSWYSSGQTVESYGNNVCETASC